MRIVQSFQRPLFWFILLFSFVTALWNFILLEYFKGQSAFVDLVVDENMCYYSHWFCFFFFQVKRNSCLNFFFNTRDVIIYFTAYVK